LLLACACQKHETPEPAAAASAALASAAPAASAAPTPAKAWYEGAWQGSYKAELFRIELAAGGLKEWKQDDGTLASGDGTLAFTVAADGTITGSAKGALGELSVSGRVEGDRAALRLDAAEPKGFHGTILAVQNSQGMQGSLNASSGDSLQVRKGNVTLSRVVP
jgi:hypothetical protein